MQGRAREHPGGSHEQGVICGEKVLARGTRVSVTLPPPWTETNALRRRNAGVCDMNAFELRSVFGCPSLSHRCMVAAVTSVPGTLTV